MSIAMIFSFLTASPLFSFIGPGNFIWSYTGAISALFVIGIPIIALFSLLIRWFGPYRISRANARNMKYLWLASLVWFLFTAFNTALDHNTYSKIEKTTTLDINPALVTVEMGGASSYANPSIFSFGDAYYDGENLNLKDVDISLLKSDDKKFKIKKTIYSNGRTVKDAEKNAEKITSNYTIEDSKIIIPNDFIIKKGSKYRGQRVHYDIYIPQGKDVQLGKKVRRNLNRRSDIDRNSERPKVYSDYVWTMEQNGLVASSYIEAINYEKNVKETDFKTLNLEGHFRIKVEKAENYEVKLVGEKEQIEKLEIVNNGGILSISDNGEDHANTLRVLVKTPSLEELNIWDAVSSHIEGFDQETMTLSNSGYGDMSAYINVKLLTLNLQGRNETTLTGAGSDMNINISNRALLNAEKYKAQTATVTGHRYRYSTLNVVDEIIYTNGYNNAKTIGNPEIIFETNN